VGNKNITGGLKGLRGKKISGGASASTGDLTIRQLMQAEGMTAGQDYSLVPFPQDSGALAALQQGTIDAAMFSEPSTSIALSQGAIVVYDQKTTGVQNVGGPLLVTRRYLAGHQDLIKRFVMADLEAMHLIKTDPQKAGQYAAKYMQLDDLNVATNAMKAEGQLMDGYLSIPLKSLASQMQVAAVSAPKVAQLKPENLVDTTLLDQILASDFMTKLYDGQPPAR
jgi:ABC-type nitrate/sulfonate/bicarbonate transport system substrate-binding protein